MYRPTYPTSIVLLFLVFLWVVFPLAGQSRIPASPGNYLQNADQAVNGDRDGINVLFFEVPDSLTGPLYIGVYSPGTNNSDLTLDAGTSMTTEFSLFGGEGALTGPNAKVIDYTVGGTDAAADGTPLSSFTEGNGNATRWRYFDPVLPSQGERIGNKYYFRVVVDVGNAGTGDKNAYQLNVSTSGTGEPTGVGGVRSFAYSWTVLLQDTNTWSLHPFVPETALSSDHVVFYNWDADGGEQWEAFNKSGSSQGAPTVSASDAWAHGAYQVSDTDERNGTWRLEIREEVTGTEPFQNTAELVHSVESSSPTQGDAPSGTILRTYAAEFDPPDPEQVVLSVDDGTAITGGTERVYLQIADAAGNPLPYARDIRVTVSDSATIDNASNIAATNTSGTDEIITTDEEGVGWVELSDAVAETVTVEAFWNGTGSPNSADSFGTASSTSVPIDFVSDPPPEMSSASNLSFTAGTAETHPDITITDSGSANITAANNIYIRIPPGLDANFDTASALTFAGTNGPVNLAADEEDFPDSKTLRLNVASDFAVGDTLVVENLPYTSTNSVSSGSLEMSVDGGSTYSILDDKVVSISQALKTWDRGGGTNDWHTDANWNPVGVPTASDVVEIPDGIGAGDYPVVSTAQANAERLLIASGTDDPSLTLDGQNLVVQGNLVAEGDLIANGSETLTIGGSVDFSGLGDNFTENSSTLVLTGASTSLATNGESGLHNLTIDKAAAIDAVSLGSDLVVGNNLDFSQGILELGIYDLTVNNDITSSGNGNIDQSGGGSISVSGTTTLDSGPQAILLDNAGNDFTGSVNLANDLTSSAEISVRDANALEVASITAGGSVTIRAGGTTLSGNVQTDGGAVTIDDTILINGTHTIDTEDGNDSAAGTVTITGAIDALNGNADTLTVNAVSGGGADAAVDLQGAYGTGTVTGAAGATGDLDIDGAQIDVDSIQVDDGPITLTATNIDLNGTTYHTTTSGSITFDGSVDLFANAGITTAGGSAATFTGAVTGNGGTQTLNVNTSAGDGTTDFQGGANITNVGALTVDAGAGNVNLRAATGVDGSIDISGGDGTAGSGTAIHLFGNLTSTGTGGADLIDINGEVELGADVTVTGAGAAGDDIDFSSEADGAQTLTVDAGTNGDVVFNGAVGGSTALAGFAIAEAAVAQVESVQTAGGVGTDTIDIGSTAAVDTLRLGVVGAVTLATDGDGQGSDAGNIRLNATNAVDVQNTVTFDTNDATAAGGSGVGIDGSITVAGGSELAGSTGAEGVIFDLGDSNLDVSGVTFTTMDFVLVRSAGDLDLGAITTNDGDNNPDNANYGIDLTASGTITLNGDLATDGLGADANTGGVRFAGASGITLAANIAIDTDDGGTGTDRDIDITVPVSATTADSETLTLQAGTDGTVNLDAVIGTAGNELGGVDASGSLIDVTANVGANGITLTGGGDPGINIGAVTLDTRGTDMVLASAGDIAIDGGASLTSTTANPNVVFRGTTDGTTIGVGTGAAGDINLSEAELARVSGNITDIEIGTAGSQTGTITIDDDTDTATADVLTLSNTNLVLHADGGAAVSQIDTGEVDLSGAAGLAFTINGAGGTTLQADISTQGGAISIDDAVTVNGAVTVDSGVGTPGTAGAIEITGAVDSNDATGDTLTFSAVGGTNNGNVTVGGNAEGGTAGSADGTDLTGFTVSGGATVSLQNVEVDDGAIDVTGDAIELNGTTYRTFTSGAITFDGPVTLFANAVVTTSDGQAATFTGAVSGDAGIETLEVNTSAGDGTTDFQGGANITNVGALTVDAGAGNVNLRAATGVDGSIDISGGDGTAGSGTAIHLFGNLTSTGTGGADLIDINGEVELGADVTVTGAGAAGDDIDFSSEADGAQTLTVDAGTNGDVVFNGAVGGSTALAGFAIAEAAVAQVESVQTAGGVGTDTIDIGSTAAVDTLRLGVVGAVTLATDGDGQGSDAGNIRLNATNAVDVQNTVTFDTNDATAAGGSGVGIDGSITVAGGSELAGSTGAEGVIFDLGDSNLDVSGVTFTTMDFVLVRSAGDLDLGAITTNDGDNNPDNANYGIDLTASGTITLNGDLATDGLGADANTGGVRFAGASGITLAANIAIDTDDGGTGTDRDIDITVPVSATTADSETLTLQAGTDGTVNLDAVIGTAGNELGGVDASGSLIDVTANVGANGITLTGGGDPGINIGAVTLDTRGTDMVLASAGDIAIDGGASLTSTTANPNVVFRGTTDGTTIGVGTGAAGDINLSEAELARVSGNITDIEIGTAGSQTGTITIDDDTDTATADVLTLSNTNLVLHADGGAAVSQIDTGEVDLSGAAGLAFTINGAGGTTLQADISTQGGAISIDDAVTVNGAVTVDSGVGTPGTAGAIEITGAVDSNDATGDTLTFSAVGGTNNGNVTVGGNAEGGTAGSADGTDLTGFTVSGGATVSLQNVEVDDGAIDVTGDAIELNGTTYQTFTSGAITFDGPVDLTAGAVTTEVRTEGAATDAISFTSTIDDDTAGQTALTIDADAGNNGAAAVDLQGAVGGGTAIEALTISGTPNQVDLADVRVQGGPLSVTASNIDLNSTTYRTVTSGAITFDGPVDLDAGGAVVVQTPGTPTGPDSIFFTDAIRDAGNDDSLELNANNGASSAGGQAVSIGGNVGDGSGNGTTGDPRSFTVSGASQIDLASVFVGNGAFLVRGSNIDLNGADYQIVAGADGDDPMNFYGPVDLHDDVTVTGAGNDATGDAVSFSDTINADNAGTNIRSLTVLAGSGDVSVTGAIGGAEAVTGGVDLTGAEISTAAITTSATLDDTAGGNVTVTGSDVVTIGGAVAAQGGSDASNDGGHDGGAVNLEGATLAVGAVDTRAGDAGTSGDGGNGGTVTMTASSGSPTITLNGNIDSSGGAAPAGIPGTSGTVDLNDPVTLGANVSIDTTDSGAGNPVGANVSFDSTVDATTSGIESLSINAGTGGNVTVSGDVGAGPEPAGFAIGEADQVDLENVDLVGGDISVTGSNIDLNGTAYRAANSGAITFDGPVDLDAGSGPVLVQTHGNTGDNITFGNVINDDTVGETALTIDADPVNNGAAAVDLQGEIGGGTAIGDFTVSGTPAQVDLDSVTVDGADVTVSATNIDLNGATYRAIGSGGISLTGVVDLDLGGGTVTLRTQGASGDDISIDGTVNDDAAGDTALTLNADNGGSGQGTVTAADAIGGGTAIGAFTVSGNPAQVDLGDVAVDNGAITVTAANIDLNGTSYQTTTSGAVSFSGPVDLDLAGGTVAVLTAGAVGDGVTFGDTVDDDAADDATQDTVLDIDAGDGTLTFDGAVGAGNALRYLRLLGAGPVEGAGPIDLSSQDVYVDAPTRTLELREDVTVGRLVFYRGTLDLGTSSVTLTTVGDFAAFGAGYEPDDVDRAAAANEFAYPPASAGPGLAYELGGSYDDTNGAWGVAPNAAFADPAGATVTVGGDFYVNGANMPGSGAWTLNLQDNTSTSPIDSPPFGSPYAVAFHMAVSHSNAPVAAPVAAAIPDGGETNNGVTDNGNTANWDFTRPEIVSAETVFDNVIRLTFSEPIENTSDEISTLVGNTAIQINDDTVDVTATWVDDDGDNSPPHSFVTTDGEGDLETFYIQSAQPWNTDATGTGGGDANSTDRDGVGQTAIPNISLLKGVLSDATGHNLIGNHGRNGQPRYTGATDEARPVLVEVLTGRAVPNNATYPEASGHNFFRLRYSEPVDIGGLTTDETDTTASNVRSETTFTNGTEHGGHFQESVASSVGSPGVVDVVGYFQYAGSMITGTRNSAQPSNNALYRAAPANPYGAHGVTIFAVGYSFDPVGGRVWPGYMYGNDRAGGTGTAGLGRPDNYPFNVSDPAGEVARAMTNPDIIDAAGNPIEPDTVQYDSDHDPKATVTITDEPAPQADEISGWDHEAPGISTFSDPPNESREIVTRIDSVTSKVTHLDFFFQDNFVSEDSDNSPAPGVDWDPENDHVDSRIAPPRGMRDTTAFGYEATGATENPVLNELNAFRIQEIGQTPESTFNVSLTTETFNFLFSDTDTPQSVNVPNDGYVGLTVDDGAHPWTNLTDLWFRYDATEARITDLAGNLLPSTPAGEDFNLRVIERIPPRIDLSLIRVGDDRVFVRFSEPVYGNLAADVEIQPSDFALQDPDGTPSSITVTNIEPVLYDEDNTGILEAYFTLSDEIDANFAVDGRLLVAGADTVYDNLQNAMIENVPYPISDIGIGVVEPVLATDSLRQYEGFGEDFTSIRDFTGAATGLVPGELRLQARIQATDHTGDLLRVFYDVAPAEENLVEDAGAVDFWLPSQVQGYNLTINSEARSVLPYQFNDGGELRTFRIPEEEEIAEGTEIEFVFRLGNLFTARSADPEDPRALAPYLIPMRGIVEQRSSVTILNNVINPLAGDKAYLTYDLPESGVVRVVVFTVNGDVVRVFHSGRQGAGSYTYAWDGTNERGNPVARGVYFIRVVGPDFDEYRKVMVVK